MKSEHVKSFFSEVKEISDKINKKELEKMVDQIYAIKKNKGRLFFLGVGGSAANSSHAVNDFRKICNIESYTPTDNVSELTARINDEGWESSLSNWLKVSKLNKNDAIFILSVGGGNLKKKVSVNLINAIKYSKKCKSKILSIIGKKDGFARTHSDVSILIPNVNNKLITPHSEAFQAVIWHCLVSHPILQVNKTKW
jgi:D-sedoheptulose 7-phosphate isomerase